MKTFLVSVLVLGLITLIACNKDKFQTKPRLEVKDYSSKEIYPNDKLVIRLNYFDKEGDLDSITGIINRINILPLSPGQDKADYIRNKLPEFPAKDFGEITMQLDYGFLKESTVENDTLIFRFTARDKAGNTSDTINTDKIVIHLP
jgi:hypothetical protein